LEGSRAKQGKSGGGGKEGGFRLRPEGEKGEKNSKNKERGIGELGGGEKGGGSNLGEGKTLNPSKRPGRVMGERGVIPCKAEETSRFGVGTVWAEKRMELGGKSPKIRWGSRGCGGGRPEVDTRIYETWGKRGTHDLQSRFWNWESREGQKKKKKKKEKVKTRTVVNR